MEFKQQQQQKSQMKRIRVDLGLTALKAELHHETGSPGAVETDVFM